MTSPQVRFNRYAVDQAEIRRIAKDKLGRWSLGVRGELRALRGALEDGEQLQTLGVGVAGVKGRLLVATDRRLLLVGKMPLRPARVERFAYEEVESPLATFDEDGYTKLSFTASGGEQSFQIMPTKRAFELADVIAERVGAEKAD